MTNETWIDSWRGRKLVTPLDSTNSFAKEDRYLEELRRAFYQFRNTNVGWSTGKSDAGADESMKTNENQ